MISCYMLLNVESKKEKKVYQALLNMTEVEGIQEVFGQYDIILKVSAKDLHTLRAYVIDRIRGVDGVTSTTTLITAEGGA